MIVLDKMSGGIQVLMLHFILKGILSDSAFIEKKENDLLLKTINICDKSIKLRLCYYILHQRGEQRESQILHCYRERVFKSRMDL